MATSDLSRTLRLHSADHVEWSIAPGWERDLLCPQGLRLAEWLASGQARVIKQGPHRVVYRVELAGQVPARSFYLKHDRASGWQAGARHLLRANPSRREWQRAEELSQLQIPTITPVALGERRRLGVVLDSYLVTEAIPGARSLLEWANLLPTMPPEQAQPFKRRLLRAAARLCAALHQAGGEHQDFHAENILVSEGGAWAEDVPAVHLIDVPGVRISQRLSWRASRNSLAMLAVGLMDHTTSADRWCFLREYLTRRPELGFKNRSQERTASQDVLTRTRATSLRVAKSRDRRLLASNKSFRRLAASGWSAHAVSEVSSETLAGLLRDPAGPLRQGIDQPVKLSHSSVVVKSTLEVAGQTVEVAYKRSRAKSIARMIGHGLVPRRRLQGWLLGHALAVRGIRTPRPLALIRRHGLIPETYLATEWIAGGLDLHSFVWKLESRPPAERVERVEQLAECLGRLIGRMHVWNVSHRDLKANNLMIVEQVDTLEAWLVDLDGVRILSRLTDDRRARDLARLIASLRRYDWLAGALWPRFFRTYLRALGRPARETTALACAAQRYADRVHAEW